MQKVARRSLGQACARLALVLYGAICGTSGVAAQSAYETVSRFVGNTREQLVWYFWEIDDNCQVVRGFNVSIPTQPQHGTVDLRRSTQTITEGWMRNFRFGEDQRRQIRRCQGSTIPVLSVYYKANPQFVGFDRLVIQTRFTNGSMRQLDVRLAVR